MSDVIQFTVNGSAVSAEQEDSDMPLVDYLHENLNQTGTKFCCGIGVCHACTVISRNSPNAPAEKMLSCSTPVSAIDGMHITTIEGVGEPDKLSPLQQAFLENFSFQCGYCAPGFLMSATVLMERLQMQPVTQAVFEDMLKTWVGENICRCTGYMRYIDAIRQVAKPYIIGEA